MRQWVKIAAGTREGDTERLRAARETAPRTKLVYGVHWAWPEVMDVLSVIRGWEDFDLDSSEAPRAPGLGIEIDWPSVERYGG